MMIDSRFEYFNSLLNLSRIISPHSKKTSPRKIGFSKNRNHDLCSNRNKCIRIKSG
ncbi:hypothetical protein GIB67_012598 [Kingdonia uniflora]|uniref:Uncharacterized protein n=1 Tax=Kingdonia uniflora TaxID=39325 RepID=A0A7J7NEP9_9MAGN|nr:hypothetical protein GIB67_012598 [Kingdonia uniflora]